MTLNATASEIQKAALIKRMNNLIAQLISSRRNLFQIAIVATILAVGTNLLSEVVSGYVNSSRGLLLTVSCLLLALAFLLFARAVLSARQVSRSYSAVLFIHPESKRPVGVPEYKFARKFEECTRAAFLENDALRHTWESAMFPERPRPSHAQAAANTPEKRKDLEVIAISRVEASEANVRPPPPLLIEATEFCLLEFLSLHLSSYFDSRDNEDGKIERLARAHIPQVLLQNRILSLLTTPIEDRAIFLKAEIAKQRPNQGELVSLATSDGARYELFDLSVPAGTLISRPKPGVLQLHHSKYTLTLEVEYGDFSASVPRYFDECYVSSSGVRHLARIIQIHVTARLNKRALVSFSGWEYFNWIDSFFEYLEEALCFETFLERIDWSSCSTRIRATRLEAARARRESAKAPTPSPRVPTDAGHTGAGN